MGRYLRGHVSHLRLIPRCVVQGIRARGYTPGSGARPRYIMQAHGINNTGGPPTRPSSDGAESRQKVRPLSEHNRHHWASPRAFRLHWQQMRCRGDAEGAGVLHDAGAGGAPRRRVTPCRPASGPSQYLRVTASEDITECEWQRQCDGADRRRRTFKAGTVHASRHCAFESLGYGAGVSDGAPERVGRQPAPDQRLANASLCACVIFPSA